MGTENSRPTYKVDIVPYITEISTALSSLKKNNPSVYNRTALGHYPVSAAETVTITGFNLTDAKYQKVAPSTEPAVAEVLVDLSASNELEISNVLSSGKIVLKVGSLYTINNMNNNDARGSYAGTVNLTTKPAGDKSVYENYYNRKPNGDNNNLLTDDVEFDVWQITPQAVKPKNGTAVQPVMAINPTNNDIGFAFVNGTLCFSMPYGTNPNSNAISSYDYWLGGIDFWTSIGMVYDDYGHSFATVAGGDINQSKADQFRLLTRRGISA